MCGRFTLTVDIEELIERFPFDVERLAYKPRFNIAPTQLVLVYGSRGPMSADYMHWGLVPFWAKDRSFGRRVINARVESLLDKPSFRGPIRTRRCLVLADGFYEWKKRGNQVEPMRITLKSEEPFGFAGLWNTWKDSTSGELEYSCTIITTQSDGLLASIHDRMPVIIPKESEKAWLAPDLVDPQIAMSLLQSGSQQEMVAYQVSALVNSVTNEQSECVNPVHL